MEISNVDLPLPASRCIRGTVLSRVCFCHRGFFFTVLPLFPLVRLDLKLRFAQVLSLFTMPAAIAVLLILMYFNVS